MVTGGHWLEVIFFKVQVHTYSEIRDQRSEVEIS